MSTEDKFEYVQSELARMRDREQDRIAGLPAHVYEMSPGMLELFIGARQKHAVFAEFAGALEYATENGQDCGAAFDRVYRNAVTALARTAANELSHTTAWVHNETQRCRVIALGAVVNVFLDATAS